MNYFQTSLLLFLLTILLSGCVTTPPAANYQYFTATATGSWDTREIKDELDGNWFSSYVLAEKDSWISTNPGIYVNTYANGRTSLFFTNGDNYICDTGFLKVRVKFDERKVINLSNGYGEFKLSNNNKSIVLFDSPYTSNSAKSDFLEMLAISNTCLLYTSPSPRD